MAVSFRSITARWIALPRRDRRPEQHGRLQREGQGDWRPDRRRRPVDADVGDLRRSHRQHRQDQRAVERRIPRCPTTNCANRTGRASGLWRPMGRSHRANGGGTVTPRPASTTTSCRPTCGAATTRTTSGLTTAPPPPRAAGTRASSTSRSATARFGLSSHRSTSTVWWALGTRAYGEVVSSDSY